METFSNFYDVDFDSLYFLFRLLDICLNSSLHLFEFVRICPHQQAHKLQSNISLTHNFKGTLKNFYHRFMQWCEKLNNNGLDLRSLPFKYVTIEESNLKYVYRKREKDLLKLNNWNINFFCSLFLQWYKHCVHCFQLMNWSKWLNLFLTISNTIQRMFTSI